MTSSAKESSNVQEGILHAEARTYLGVFIVRASQIKPHPFQRPLELLWVQHLRECFIPGMDRSANQIKAVPADPNEEHRLEQLAASGTNLTSLPHLPEDIQLLVFDGQHRIAACLQLEDINEHWWIVRIYRQGLEHSFPAEFIGMMHLANNPTLILETSEAFRLKGMYRLRKLLEEKKITQDVYRANRIRVTGSKESVMRGLNNVSADFSLLTAVHDSLLNKHVAASFSASSWKSLTTGRFYGILRWLLYEMVAQVKILQGDASECSSKPFMLNPRVTTFKHLESVDNGHAWNELPGGAIAALNRLREGPAAHNISTPLLKAAGGNWTLGDRAFIPTVMGSNVITDRLEIMYMLVNIVAGTQALEQYTSNKRARDESDHPFTIFNIVLGKKALNREGKPGNGALKILVNLWTEYRALEQGLLDHNINLKIPKQTCPAEYQRLVNGSHAWWTLLSIFKTPKFEKGLGIEVAPKFGPSPQSPVASQPLPLETTQPVTSPAAQAETLSGDQDDSTPSNNLDMTVGSLEHIGGEDSGRQVTHSNKKAPKPKNTTGSKRSRDEGPSDDEDYGSPSVGKRVTRSQTSVSNADGSGSKDRVLDKEIHRLTDRARRMDPLEAGSVASLLNALQELEGPVAVEVNQMLYDLMPKVIAKAEKRLRGSHTYDDEDEPDLGGH